MLENVAEIYDESQLMMGKLKKKHYEERMADFREKHGHYIDEMFSYITAAPDKKVAAEEIADIFTQTVFDEKSKKGKIKGRVQMDLNMFMIYYVFPAILLTDHEDAILLCDSIKESWGNRFKNSRIEYTDYKTMYDSFSDKLLGIF